MKLHFCNSLHSQPSRSSSWKFFCLQLLGFGVHPYSIDLRLRPHQINLPSGRDTVKVIFNYFVLLLSVCTWEWHWVYIKNIHVYIYIYIIRKYSPKGLENVLWYHVENCTIFKSCSFFSRGKSTPCSYMDGPLHQPMAFNYWVGSFSPSSKTRSDPPKLNCGLPTQWKFFVE